MREEQLGVESGASSTQSSVSQRARDGGFMRAVNATITDWVLAGGRRSGIGYYSHATSRQMLDVAGVRPANGMNLPSHKGQLRVQTV